MHLDVAGHLLANRGFESRRPDHAGNERCPSLGATGLRQSLGRGVLPVLNEEFRDAMDAYVHSEELASWQLRVLAPYATKLGKKKLASAVDS